MDVIPKKGSGRLLETDRASGMARNFSCGYSGLLCGDEFTIMEDQMTDGDTVEFGDQVPVTCTSGEPQFCNGEQTGTGGSFNFSWESGTPAIAAISGESTFDYVNLLGVKAGTSTIQGQIRSQSCETGGQGPQTVQVPAYFFSPSAVKADGDCASGEEGSFYNVSYYVADLNSLQVNQAEMTPLEEAPGTVGYEPFATPPTTNASGAFNDVPVGTCFGGVPSGENVCRSVFTVSYYLTNASSSYLISTTTKRLDCALGQQLVIQGNPVSQNKTYTQGRVN